MKITSLQAFRNSQSKGQTWQNSGLLNQQSCRSEWLTKKGQSSFEISAIWYTYLACKTLFVGEKKPINQYEWPIKVSSFGKPDFVFQDVQE